MKNKLYSKSLYVLLFAAAFMLVACRTDKSDDHTPSKKAEQIIYAMMSCPNSELYEPSSVSVIGENTEDQAGSEDDYNISGKMYQNWEKKIGECFSEQGLQDFLTTGPAFNYFIEADQRNVEIKVKDMELLERSELTEKTKVILQKGDEEETVVLVFRYDSNGNVSEVRIESE